MALLAHGTGMEGRGGAAYVYVCTCVRMHVCTYARVHVAHGAGMEATTRQSSSMSPLEQ